MRTNGLVHWSYKKCIWSPTNLFIACSSEPQNSGKHWGQAWWSRCHSSLVGTIHIIRLLLLFDLPFPLCPAPSYLLLEIPRSGESYWKYFCKSQKNKYLPKAKYPSELNRKEQMQPWLWFLLYSPGLNPSAQLPGLILLLPLQRL